MTVTHDQDELAVRDTRGLVPEGARRDAETAVPRHPDAEPDNDEALPYWDGAGGFPDETTMIGSTVESDEKWGEGRHWLVDASGTRGLVQITYPSPVTCPPTALGDGTWFTPSASRDAVQVWTLEPMPGHRPGD
ncbi:hypothetical protein [Streptomyces sp. NPDC052036]|uniref:hypothetical protein n=1 Tax=unclassified Streptomyces TaxID=2593676 RepID=UPI00344A723B